MPDTNYSESHLLYKTNCEECGSSDGNGVYDDGHTYCFVCSNRTYDKPQTKKKKKPKKRDLIETGHHKALTKRGISRDTCEFWSYWTARYFEDTVQVANYKDTSGKTITQKIRWANKDFLLLGKTSNLPLYGQWLWNKGKKLVITEGELDALSVSQLQANKWPVVSVPNGADGAAKAIKQNLEWVEQFEEVIFMFDNDKPGQEAALECAALLSPGKAKIAKLSLKDPNEMLMAGKGQEVIQAIWNASTYRPDEVICASDIWDDILRHEVHSLPYPWECINTMTKGIRTDELVLLTAGSGVGKSQVCREIAYSLLNTNHKVGYIALEENLQRTMLGFMAIHLNKPVHIDKGNTDELKRAFDAITSDERLYLYNHFGSTDYKNLLSRIRYMARAYDIRYFVLDHISIVVSGISDGDERRLIDNFITSLRALISELNITVFAVSHLKRPDGKSKAHEEGGRVSASQIRGSGAPFQLADIALAFERNQQGKNPNRTTVRCLKNRFSGDTGICGYLFYDHDTTRLTEIEPPSDEEDLEEDF